MRTHLALITAADLPPATSAQSRSVPEVYRIIDLVVWANENASAKSTFVLDSVVKDQARAIMEFFADVNEDSSIELKLVNDVLSKQLTGSYFVCLHVPSLKALAVIDLAEPPPSLVAAYVFTGRATPSTIAIRNVYTRGPHRRKGLAEALVNAATTYWLKGVEGSRKTEVALFVEPGNPAERVYRKCGFTITDVAYEQRGWEGVEKGAF
jgi:GNAT superfamily N-acetyltransferase